MLEQELTDRLIGIALKVHTNLGPGLLESVYEKAMAFELAALGIAFERQKEVPVDYMGTDLGIGFRADMVVEDRVILELKSVDVLGPVHGKQLLTYMKLGRWKVGLLLNFNVARMKDGIKRYVNNG